MLSALEVLELEGLERHQRSKRIMFQQEFDRMRYLRTKQYHEHCLNPTCTGGHFPGEIECSRCKRPLFKIDVDE